MPLDHDATYLRPSEHATFTDRLVSVNDCAAMSGIPVANVYRAVRQGRIRKYRCGRTMYVSWKQWCGYRDDIHPYWSTIMFGDVHLARVAGRWRREHGLERIKRPRA